MWRYRIITFMAYPPLLGTPKTLLTGGSREITLGEQGRVFTVRKVYYDDNMTPMYAEPISNDEQRYTGLELEYSVMPALLDSSILDNDHSLKVYEP